MTLGQRIVLCVGLIAITKVCISPPWIRKEVEAGVVKTIDLGNHSLFNPPPDATIDVIFLIGYLTPSALLTAGLIVFLGRRHSLRLEQRNGQQDL